MRFNRSRLLQTTSVRLAALGLGLASTSAVIVFVLIWFGALGAMRAALDTNIDNEMAEILVQGPATPRAVVVAEVRAAVASAPAGVFFAYRDRQGRVLAGDPALPMPPPGWHRLAASPHHDFAPRVQVLRARVQPVGGGRLLVAADATTLDELGELILRSFGIGFGITLAIGLAAGIGFGRRALARVEAVGAAGREIMRGDLARRIPLSGSGDEFDHLAENINAMLARIETLMEDIRAVGNEIAHDLRSPLARLRGELELALREPERMPEAIEDAIRQVDAVLALSAAILRLAQIESGARRAFFAPIDLTRLLGEIAETFETVVEDAGGTFAATIAPRLAINGDAALLNQLFANLIENALAHAGPAAAIVLAARPVAQGVKITIADDGPGIPPGRRAEALRRFGRLDPSRTAEGNGLGLSLAAAIAGLHGGTLRLAPARPENGRPGLAAIIFFPAIPPR